MGYTYYDVCFFNRLHFIDFITLDELIDDFTYASKYLDVLLFIRVI